MCVSLWDASAYSICDMLLPWCLLSVSMTMSLTFLIVDRQYSGELRLVANVLGIIWLQNVHFSM